MTVPDYIISRTIAEEHRHRRAQNSRDTDIPEARPRERRQNDRLSTLRAQLGAALHTVASRIEPEPTGSR